MIDILRIIDLAAISPLLILLGGSLLLLLLESFFASLAKSLAGFLALIVLVSASVAAFYAPISDHPYLTPWLRFDTLARFFTLFFLLIGIASTLLAEAFFARFEASRGEYYFLLFSALVGLILISSSADFLTLFIGLETLSISLYVLCGYMKKWKISHEAAIKYFLMGALAAAFLLYGIALIYGALGTTRFADLLSGYQALTLSSDKALFYAGIVFITLGLAFEAAIVPFHVWAPDVYDGAPTPVTAFMAVGTKVGAFAAFIVIFFIALPAFDWHWNQAIALLSYPTLIYANLVAMRQTQMRRFFAYSGIAHASFLLLPVAAGTPDALLALLFYLVIYALATLGCFAVLAFLDEKSEGVLLNDLSGLFRRSPLLASILAFCLLTLAGIPPTVGFLAKFYLFKVAFQAGYHALVVVALLTTIFSAFYYMRIMGWMFAEPSKESVAPQFSWSAALVGIFACGLILLLTVYPAPLLAFLADLK